MKRKSENIFRNNALAEFKNVFTDIGCILSGFFIAGLFTDNILIKSGIGFCVGYISYIITRDKY